MRGVAEFLFSIPLQVVLGIGAMIMAGTLPKTEKGRLLAMLIAFGMIFANFHMWLSLGHLDSGSHGPGWLHESGFLVWPCVLLVIATVAMALIKGLEGQKLLALLPVAGALLIFFALERELAIKIQQDKNHRLAASIAARARQAAYDELRQKELRERDLQIEQRAKKMMPETCKKSRESIYRTAENVDGVLLLDGWWENNFVGRTGDYGGYRYIDSISLPGGGI
jgi:hypothetical protein